MAFASRKTKTTTQRGYGTDHMKARERAIAKHQAGDPCSRCGGAMPADPKLLHFDHTDDRTGYKGLAHAACNLAAGARKGNAARRSRARGVVLRTSQRW